MRIPREFQARLTILLLLPLAAGCAAPITPFNGPGGPVPPQPARAVLCSLGSERVDARTVGPTGDELGIPAGGHRLRVPAGTVPAATPFEIRERAAPYVVLWFRPFANPNNRPVEVTLSTARCGANQPEDIRVVRRRNLAQPWDSVPGVDVSRQGRNGVLTATFSVTEFSYYALVVP